MDKLLTLCMIARDEEKVIRTCLESVSGLVDEIVVVDTGSVDRTKEIVAEYTDKIYDFTWIKDFSAAKNEALRHATGRWILVLDADEYVQPDGKEALRDHIRGLQSDRPIGFVLPIFNYLGDTKQNKFLESSAIRLFPNREDVHFFRPIHEQVMWSNGDIAIDYYNFKIFHTGYTMETRKSKNKSERNLDIFDSLKEKQNLNEYDYYTLANEYLITRDLKKALYYYQRAYAKASKDRAWLGHCVNQMMTVLFDLDRLADAHHLIEESMQRWPEYSDYYFFRGFLYSHLGFNEQAIQQFNRSIEIAEKAAATKGRFWLVTPSYGSTLSYGKLANLYAYQMDMTKTVYCLSKLINLEPNDHIVLYQLINFLLQQDPGNPDAVIAFLDKAYPDTPANTLLKLQISLLLGNRSLSEHYISLSEHKEIPTTPNYRLLYAIVCGDRSSFDASLSDLASLSAGETNKLVALASCLWQQPDYTAHLLPGEQNEDKSYMDILSILFGQAVNDDKVALDVNLLVTLLTDLFKMGHYEAYDWLIGTFDNMFDILANMLGDYFFSYNHIELALDYYSLLLDQDKLLANGYENVGRLYLHQGEIEEGLGFLRKAIDLNTKNVRLYTVYLSYCVDKTQREQVKALFLNEFPQYKAIPIVREMLKV